MKSSTLAAVFAFIFAWTGLDAVEAEPILPEARHVSVGFELTNIPAINEPAETFVAIFYLHLAWHDPSVAFDGAKPKIWLEEAALAQLGEMWSPDVQFANEDAPPDYHTTVLTVHPDGLVEVDREVEVGLSSPLDLHSFPFDHQQLQIVIESAGLATDQLVLEPSAGNMLGIDHLPLEQWRPEELNWTATTRRNRLSQAEFSRLEINLVVARQPAFYVWQIFVPLFLLIGMASAIFFLEPTDLADRMNVVVAALLTAVALTFAVHTDLPKVPYLTVVDKMFVRVYVFLGAKMIAMLISKRIAERSPTAAATFDRRARWIFPAAFLGVNLVLVGRVILFH